MIKNEKRRMYEKTQSVIAVRSCRRYGCKHGLRVCRRNRTGAAASCFGFADRLQRQYGRNAAGGKRSHRRDRHTFQPIAGR